MCCRRYPGRRSAPEAVQAVIRHGFAVHCVERRCSRKYPRRSGRRRTSCRRRLPRPDTAPPFQTSPRPVLSPVSTRVTPRLGNALMHLHPFSPIWKSRPTCAGSNWRILLDQIALVSTTNDKVVNAMLGIYFEMCQRMGRPPISTIGLGRMPVSSLSRVPRPPARITAFISSSYIANRPLCRQAKPHPR